METNAAVAFCPSTLSVRKVSLQARLLKSPNRGTFRVTKSLCSFVSFGTTVRVSAHNDFGRHFVSLLPVFVQLLFTYQPMIRQQGDREVAFPTY